MATLGYRDSGSVVLSKAEALRQAHEKEGERSRLMTWSKRKSPPRRKKDEREEREKEEAAEFEMKLENILQKRPDKRLKWLQKGMILVGRKTIKANAFFDLIMDKIFISDVPPEIGTKMKASVLANLHLFSSKQQKALQSESCHFNTFASVAAKAPKREGEPKKKKPKRAKDSRDSDFDSMDSRGPGPKPREPARTAPPSPPRTAKRQDRPKRDAREGEPRKKKPRRAKDSRDSDFDSMDS
eukprot:CAMPEP_0114644672 /NCGR_PEP_ID=MMETSP0191-20121206/4100_1 /TAXON_ID=126664 /ORGANISM="Sorites sp." /LENGTH=240 /DNA_ID=CAMNT_0001857165 /DNA_START=52 /DNA_END=770 /DNA_ORIENTATION=+